MTNHDKILKKWGPQGIRIEQAQASLKAFLADTEELVGCQVRREKLLAILRLRKTADAAKMLNALQILGYVESCPGVPGKFFLTGTPATPECPSPLPGVGLWAEAEKSIEAQIDSLLSALVPE